ncbi:UNVERIFIED_CONTAM: hypothetical protein FKN15_055135 [Acipenser sinensis]
MGRIIAASASIDAGPERFQVKNPPHTYILKLKGYLDPAVTRKKFRRRVQESTQVLRELEISLRTNHIGWVREFLNEENKGLDVLVEYLSFAQYAVTLDFDSLENNVENLTDKSKPWSRSIEDLHRGSNLPSPVGSSISRSSRHSTLRYNTLPSRRTLKNSRLVSKKDDVHVCIMCLRAIMNYQYGFNMVMSHLHAVNEIALSLNNKNPRTKALVLELLAAVCLVRGGHEIILSAFDNFKEVCAETQRFEKLMEHFKNEDNNIDFMVACMQFINIMVHSVEDMNFRVHLQYEFTKLCLDEYLEKLKHTESDKLQVQIQAYLDNVFDVGALLEDAETKNAALERVEELEENISHMSEKLQDTENEAMAKIVELEKQLMQRNKELDSIRDVYRDASSQVHTLRRMVKEKDEEIQKQSNLEKKIHELEKQGALQLQKKRDGDIAIHTSGQQGVLSTVAYVGPVDPMGPDTGALPGVSMSPPPPPPPPVPGAEVETVRNYKVLLGIPSVLPGDLCLHTRAIITGGRLKLKHTESDKLQVQIQAYLDNVFDVGALLEDAETKNAALERVEELEENISHMSEKLQDTENEAMAKIVELEKQLMQRNKELDSIRDIYRDASSQVHTLKRLVKEKDEEIQKQSNLEKKIHELEKQGALTIQKKGDGDIAIHTSGQQGVLSTGSEVACVGPVGPTGPDTGAIPGVSMSPPPPPPLPVPGAAVKIKKPIKTKFRLPVFNWVALKPNQINGTVFNEIDDEKILEDLNVDEFEEMFKTKAQGPAVDVTSTKLVIQKGPNKVTLLEANRAKNLAITLRKAGKTSEEICKAIQMYSARIILALGNYMNSSKRGAVYGFKLQSLDLLLDTKSTDRKQTLLHYIANVVKEKYIDVSLYYNELHYVEKAAAVSLDNVLMDVKELQRGMDLTKREYSMHGHNTILKDFININEGKLKKLQDDAKISQASGFLLMSSQDAFDEVLKYFGENSKTTPPSVFFPVFVRFVKAYRQAEEDNEQRKKQEQALMEKLLEQEMEQQDPKSPSHKNKRQQQDLIAELRKKQVKDSRHVYEGKDGAIEDIITDLRNQPYRRADAVRRSVRRRFDDQNLRSANNVEITL